MWGEEEEVNRIECISHFLEELVEKRMRKAERWKEMDGREDGVSQREEVNRMKREEGKRMRGTKGKGVRMNARETLGEGMSRGGGRRVRRKKEEKRVRRREESTEREMEGLTIGGRE